MEGEGMEVNVEAERVLREFHSEGKPIGYAKLCLCRSSVPYQSVVTHTSVRGSKLDRSQFAC